MGLAGDALWWVTHYAAEAIRFSADALNQPSVDFRFNLTYQAGRSANLAADGAKDFRSTDFVRSVC